MAPHKSVTISSSTSGASIRYTTNGTTPSSTVGTVYSSAVSITANTTLQAIAYKSGLSNSAVASGNYTIQCAAPTFSPAAGAYGSTQTVTISTTTSGASIRYTTDGTTPTSTVGTVYSSAVSISATATLQAIAYETGMTNSRGELCRSVYHQCPADHRHVALVERRGHHRHQQRRFGDDVDRLQRQRQQCRLHPGGRRRRRPAL